MLGMTRLLTSIYRELVNATIACVSIFEYFWHVVNMFMCILLLVHSLCTRQNIVSFLEMFRVLCKNMSVIVNLVVSCTLLNVA